MSELRPPIKSQWGPRGVMHPSRNIPATSMTGVTLVRPVWVYPGDVHFSKNQCHPTILHPISQQWSVDRKGFNKPKHTKQKHRPADPSCRHLQASYPIPDVLCHPGLVEVVHRTRGGPRDAPQRLVTTAGRWGTNQVSCNGGSTTLDWSWFHPGNVHISQAHRQPHPLSYIPQPCNGLSGPKGRISNKERKKSSLLDTISSIALVVPRHLTLNLI